MFRGNHPARVDEKGRLKLPVEHKRQLETGPYGEEFFITSKDGERAEIYPMREWERVEEKLSGIPSMNPAKRKFLDVTSYYGQVVSFDTQGRLLIPQLLREKARLTGDVAVIGQERMFVVVNDEAMQARLEANKLTDADNEALAALGM